MHDGSVAGRVTSRPQTGPGRQKRVVPRTVLAPRRVQRVEKESKRVEKESCQSHVFSASRPRRLQQSRDRRALQPCGCPGADILKRCGKPHIFSKCPPLGTRRVAKRVCHDSVVTALGEKRRRHDSDMTLFRLFLTLFRLFGPAEVREPSLARLFSAALVPSVALR